MATMVESGIEVNVPVSVAYNQWTQFEEFPRFMEGVESVEQLDDTHLHWRAAIGGVTEEWDAEITEQIPDKRIAWCAETGAPNAGVVTFHRLSEDKSRVMLQLSYEPSGVVERVGDYLRVVRHRIDRDLRRFRDFVEEHRESTGAWRGEVPSKEDRSGGTSH